MIVPEPSDPGLTAYDSLRITSLGPLLDECNVAVEMIAPGLLELCVTTPDGEIHVTLTLDEARDIGASLFGLADDNEAVR